VNTHTEICQAIAHELNKLELGQIKAAKEDKTSCLSHLWRLHRVYKGAHDRSKNFGYIGVGCISFAQARVKEFNRRVARLGQ
jgi:glutaredoxin-related protein